MIPRSLRVWRFVRRPVFRAPVGRPRPWSTSNSFSKRRAGTSPPPDAWWISIPGLGLMQWATTAACQSRPCELDRCANLVATFVAASQRSLARCSYPRFPTSPRIQAPKLFHGPQNPCPVVLSDVPCGSGTIGATLRQLFGLVVASGTSRSPRRAKPMSGRGRDGLDAAKTGGI